MDYLAFRLINDYAGQHGWLDGVMVAIASYGSLVFAVVLLWLWGLRTDSASAQNRLVVARALAAAAAALALGQIIIRALPRARPFSSHNVHLLIPHSPDPSFPSDHALAAFAIAAAVVSSQRRLGIALFGFGALLGIARVFVGMHYPLDILGGGRLGGTIGWLAHRADPWLRPVVEVASRRTGAVFRKSRWPRRPTHRA